jgi:hypothetical protein
MRYDLIAKILADAYRRDRQTYSQHRMPADIDAGVLVRGPLDGIKVDHEIPGYFKAPIQVIYRHFDQDQGDTKARAIVAALTLHNRELLDGATPVCSSSRCSRDPADRLPRLDGDGIEWSINFDTVWCEL